MMKPIQEAYYPEGIHGECIPMLAFYLDYPSFVQKRAVIKYGKGKMSVLMRHEQVMQAFLDQQVTREERDYPLVIRWPWGGEERLSRAQCRLMLNCKEEVLNWLGGEP